MDAKFEEAINGIMDNIKSELNYIENQRLHFADLKIRLLTLGKIADMCDILERIADSLEKKEEANDIIKQQKEKSNDTK